MLSPFLHIIDARLVLRISANCSEGRKHNFIHRQKTVSTNKRKLTGGERTDLTAVLIEIPVTLLQTGELIGDDEREGRAQKASWRMSLRHSGDKQVDLIRAFVKRFHLVDDLVRSVTSS